MTSPSAAAASAAAAGATAPTTAWSRTARACTPASPPPRASSPVLAHIPVPQLTCLSAALAWRSTASNPSVCALADTVREIALVDPLLARPGQPAVPERPYLGRLGHADRQEVRLDQEVAPPGRALATRFSTAIRASATW